MSKKQRVFFLSSFISVTTFILYFFHSLELFEETTFGLITVVAIIITILGLLLFYWVKKNKQEVERCFDFKI